MTIKDLAKETGYSVGTISRVLNNQPNVSQKARDAILAIVHERGFQLNTNAKTLKQQRSNCIAAVVKGTANEMFASLVEQLQALFAATEHPLIVDFIDEDANEVKRAVQLCAERKPLGLMFLGATNTYFEQDFARIAVPTVVVTNDASRLPFENLSSVTTDDRKGAACAVEYLLRAGHKDVAVLGGDRSLSDTSALRYEGCLEAYARCGMAFDEPRLYHTGRYSYASGYQAMQAVLRDTPEVTAVFAMADVIAIGAIRAACDAGLRVPEDISVVGYDGLAIGGYYCPKLTTITQSLDRLAQRSFEILMACVENGAPAKHITVPFTLSCRESVRNLAKE